jgi:small subunit ribosomal protein S2
MSENPTAESASSTGAPVAEQAASFESLLESSAQSSAIGMRDLLEAGVHFGHQTRRWHPNMKPFLYGERNGVHIINLQYTLPRLRSALDFVRETVANGGKVMFVATKRQAQDIIAETARSCSMPFVHRRWLGGMLTNFRTVRRSIDRYKELTELLSDESAPSSPSKKERSRLVREHLKLHKAFEGMVDLASLPDALFVIDIRSEAIAIQEARRLQIPIVAIVDSNCDPEGIEFVVPGNDDALRAIRLYCEKVAAACREGAVLFNDRIVSERAKKPEQAEAEAPRPTTSRRVVDITQPARRPARMERMVEERRKEAEETGGAAEAEGQANEGGEPSAE